MKIKLVNYRWLKTVLKFTLKVNKMRYNCDVKLEHCCQPPLNEMFRNKNHFHQKIAVHFFPLCGHVQTVSETALKVSAKNECWSF